MVKPTTLSLLWLLCNIFYLRVKYFYNVLTWTEMERGGHFAAMEVPELLVTIQHSSSSSSFFFVENSHWIAGERCSKLCAEAAVASKAEHPRWVISCLPSSLSLSLFKFNKISAFILTWVSTSLSLVPVVVSVHKWRQLGPSAIQRDELHSGSSLHCRLKEQLSITESKHIDTGTLSLRRQRYVSSPSQCPSKSPPLPLPSNRSWSQQLREEYVPCQGVLRVWMRHSVRVRTVFAENDRNREEQMRGSREAVVDHSSIVHFVLCEVLYYDLHSTSSSSFFFSFHYCPKPSELNVSARPTTSAP